MQAQYLWFKGLVAPGMWNLPENQGSSLCPPAFGRFFFFLLGSREGWGILNKLWPTRDVHSNFPGIAFETFSFSGNRCFAGSSLLGSLAEWLLRKQLCLLPILSSLGTLLFPNSVSLTGSSLRKVFFLLGDFQCLSLQDHY